MTLIEQLRSKKKALTVEELAGLLCVAVRTLYKEVEDDHIPFFRVRTSIRFDPHQVADWLEMKMPAATLLGRKGRAKLSLALRPFLVRIKIVSTHTL